MAGASPRLLLLALRPEPLAGEVPAMNLSSCAYYQTQGQPDGQRGTCSFGCRDEPRCLTEEPVGGWAAADHEPNDGEVLYRHADGSIEVVTQHCYHHSHNSECGAEYGDCDDDANDDCVCCPCCCTCLGCEYGPQDGMLMYPDGPAPWLAEVEAEQAASVAPKAPLNDQHHSVEES